MRHTTYLTRLALYAEPDESSKQMNPGQNDLILSEVIDAMADKALEDAGQEALQAIARFSAGVDRLVEWLPVDRRLGAFALARAHGYATPGQLAKMRGEESPLN